MRRRVFVLSDLHLGPGGPMTSFHEHERLGRLLHSWIDDDDLRELVLAGDIFDFLQVPNYDGFSADKAFERFELLIRYAPTAHVLTALRQLAQRPSLDVTVLAGNHDPELMLPAVRGAFEAQLGRRGSVRWADDQPLVPRQGKRLPLWGRSVHGPGVEDDIERQAWIVHGDRWDPQNVFDRDQVRRSAETGEPFSLPPGSHLVFEVLSKLVHSNDRRWVAEVKPDAAAALLLLARHRAELLGHLKQYHGVTERMLSAWLKQFARRGPTLGEDRPLEDEGSPAAPDVWPRELMASLAEGLALLDTTARQRTLGSFEAYLVQGEPPSSEGTLGGGMLSNWVLRAACRYSAESGFIDRKGGDSLPAKAAKLVPAGLGALVAGHTHGPRELPAHRYYNSGTWMPVRLLSRDEHEALRLLEAPYQPVPSPGTYVRIELADGPPAVSVEAAP